MAGSEDGAIAGVWCLALAPVALGGGVPARGTARHLSFVWREVPLVRLGAWRTWRTFFHAREKAFGGPKQLREPRQTCTRLVTNLSAEAGGGSGEENEERRADACLGQAASLKRGCCRTTALKVTPKSCETAREYTRTVTSGRLCRKLRLYKKPEVM